MKKEVTIMYRGEVIDYWDSNFRVDGDKKYPTLEQACEAVDQMLKVQIDKTPVFFENYSDRLVTAIATSVNEQGEVFVSFPEKKGKYGSREKRGRKENIFLDTPENREKYAIIEGIRKEASEAMKEYEERVAVVIKTMKQIREPKL